jgi:serine/threonine protein kinase
MKDAAIQNKYKILKILGQDSLTETFLAQGKGLCSFHRYVIKKFRPILGNPQAREIKHLFDREAKILKLLSGKNRQFPQLYEYFIDGEDFYLVREWIEGLTLEQKVQQQGKLSETEVKQILGSVLSVLKDIHNYDLVYRELSPSSIVLREGNWLERASNQDCLPVPIYFGRVKELARETQRLNQRSLVLANRQEYISPESEPGELAYASDLYSLGLTAIYLLTGKTPTELNTDSYTNQLLWHQEVPHLTTNLVSVIDRAICYDRSNSGARGRKSTEFSLAYSTPTRRHRFTSAEEMLQALFPRSVNISESLITQPKQPSWLTPEVKIVSSLFCLGLGVIGIAFSLLNFDFDGLMVKESTVITTNEPELSTDRPSQSTVRSSLEKQGKVNQKIATVSESTSKSTDSFSPPQAGLKIPAFRVGTPQQQVLSLLGKPTLQSKGYWDNSRAFLYQDFVSQQVDLGYLSDVQSQTILQTEVSFAESVEGVEIQEILQQLLMADYSAQIEQKIDLVVSQKSNKQEFAVNNLQGIIQRNSQNHVYVAVWKSGFHQ